MHDKFPNEFTARVAGQGYIESESLLAALAAESPVSVRINRAKWAGAPAGATPVPWCGSGYWLPARPVFTIDPLFQAGCYYVQEASGMFLEQAVRHTGCDAPGLRILDLCAAPGGKATHLASLAGPGSMIVANEVIRSRASVLAANITRWGTGNTIVTCSDASAFGKLEGYFDMILADAPCSGEGMFRDEVARREWSTSNCGLCAGRQRRILSSVWPALKRGGVLVYSTCTFNPAENEEVTDWMMKSFYCSADLPPVTGFDGITVVPGGSGTAGYGFYPGKVRGEGLFMSVLRRNDGTAGSPEFSSRDGTVRRLAGNLLAEAARLAGAGAERLVMTSDTVTLLPAEVPEYQWLSSQLGIVSAGVPLFSMAGSDIIPRHALALYTGLKRGEYPEAGAGASEAIKFMRRESDTGIRASAAGWNLVVHRGVPLGFIKNLGRRLNNYFPVEWRIRMDAGGAAGGIL